MNRRILVVAAHADDEVLGCGGTIARHVAEGDSVALILMADGVGSRPDADLESLGKRNAAAQQAREILGIQTIYSLGFPDNQMDSIPLLDIVRSIEPLIEGISPHIIYTHHYGDLNVDHRITQHAVMTACRPLPGSSVSEIYGFEVLSSTEWATPHEKPFIPTLYVDISAFLDTKIRGIGAYREEMRCVPHSRSTEHAISLAKHRGYSVGLSAAEAFMVYRICRA